MKFENRYNHLDRFLHQLAFSLPGMQKALVDVEDQLYKDLLKQQQVENPVFITSLPRAGTTLLLEILYDSGCFYSHTYRNMPFIMIPLLWGRLSDAFSKDTPRNGTRARR